MPLSPIIPEDGLPDQHSVGNERHQTGNIQGHDVIQLPTRGSRISSFITRLPNRALNAIRWPIAKVKRHRLHNRLATISTMSDPLCQVQAIKSFLEAVNKLPNSEDKSALYTQIAPLIQALQAAIRDISDINQQDRTIKSFLEALKALPGSEDRGPLLQAVTATIMTISRQDYQYQYIIYFLDTVNALPNSEDRVPPLQALSTVIMAMSDPKRQSAIIKDFLEAVNALPDSEDKSALHTQSIPLLQALPAAIEAMSDPYNQSQAIRSFLKAVNELPGIEDKQELYTQIIPLLQAIPAAIGEMSGTDDQHEAIRLFRNSVSALPDSEDKTNLLQAVENLLLLEDSLGKATSIAINETILRESPLDVLSAIVARCSNAFEVTLISADGKASPGQDAGGLRRHVVSNIFTSLLAKGQLLREKEDSSIVLASSPDTNMEHFKQLGQLLSYVYTSGCFIGNALPQELFTILSALSSSDYQQLKDPLPDSLILTIQGNREGYYFLRTCVENSSDGENINLDGLNKLTKDFIKHLLGRESLPESLTIKELAARVLQDENIKAYVNKIKSIAIGMYERLGDERLKEFAGVAGGEQKLHDNIEGAITPQSLIKALTWRSVGESVNEHEKKHMETWIQQHPDRISNFILAVTGSRALGPTTTITISLKRGDEFSLPSSHTCSRELVLPDYDTQKVFNEKMQLFIDEGLAGTGFQVI
ncbi:MAG: hypothetical protein HN411_05900 [Waddliaceae bacterium]|nr:hypothetical protein [Waddliaceae bacterium]MBT3579052.1 hypothetical protein [Waddliaceae bacterium]MBT4444485.1 hypothetical protein [Waddliaceae bacterium]MBT6929074.1 hypothetical protein [Waddliaceae bacterium]